jgi:hypothetical protein
LEEGSAPKNSQWKCGEWNGNYFLIRREDGSKYWKRKRRGRLTSEELRHGHTANSIHASQNSHHTPSNGEDTVRSW